MTPTPIVPDSHPKMALDRRGSTAAAPEHSQRPHDREFTPGVRRRWLGHASLCASISASRPYYRTGLMARDAGHAVGFQQKARNEMTEETAASWGVATKAG